MANYVAQATGVPPSGASNAEDFQPPTRNPQADAVPTQPQASNLQEPAASDLLSNQEARLILPSGRVAGTSTATTSSVEQVATTNDNGFGGTLSIVVLGAVIVMICTFLFDRRDRRAKKAKPAPVEASVKSTETVKKSLAKKPKTTNKKKSKSKRKRK